MSQFILLLHNSPTAAKDVSPEEIQRIIEQYAAWRQDLENRGRLVGANKLRDDAGKVLNAKNGKLRVVDGPFSEAKEVVGGYFIIEANDYDEAAEICSGCPHLKFGGAIELRMLETRH